MKIKLKFFSLACILLAFTLCLAACNDNDGPDGSAVASNVSKVLPLGVPRSIASIDNMVYDDQNRLTSCSWGGYLNVHLAYNGNKVTVTYTHKHDGDIWTLNCTLGSNGFTESYVSFDDGEESSPIYFEYDASGHLIGYHYKGTYSVRDCKIIYNEEGDIVRVEDYVEDSYYNEKETDISLIQYTGDGVSEPIVNKSGVMLFDECFYIDVDEALVLYYAGLLGTATTHYPVILTTPYNTRKFTWNIANDGKPTSVTETYYYDSDEDGEVEPHFDDIEMKWK